ncbi:MAG: chromate transporter [Bacteroidetes bacterium MED-G17]|nr:MAG: chromate transporter [Bacteroidetes bacterium MED-G17]
MNTQTFFYFSHAIEHSKLNKIKRYIFLKDVFWIAISAFGGPEMHLALYSKRMVNEKKYLSHDELLELYALCQILPGPTSTQTLTSMGYRFGGAKLAFLTLLVWITPAALFMTVLAFIYIQLSDSHLQSLKYIEPLAVSFVIVAAIKMVRSVAKDSLSVILISISFLVTGILRHPLGEYVKTPWMFPILILFGSFLSYLVKKGYRKHKKIKVKAPWKFLFLFFFIFIIAAILGKVLDLRIIKLFENNYRFGSLIFGGGTVLLPLMYEQFVSFKGYISSQAFLTGLGLIQATPGPVFSFATFTSGLSMRTYGPGAQMLGHLVGTVGIFLPGILMIFFVYPIWDQIKKHPVVRRSLDGAIASSAGLVAAAAYLLFLPVGLRWQQDNNFHLTNLLEKNYINQENILAIALVVPMIFYSKIPTPIWVIIALFLGFIL